ncbi:MAG: hypothetical protein OIN90_19430, partial [Candidatus Methanoperedens sp.]|nr:hypothetical protein [Candidatus Methanoperedens sp.]
MTLRFEGYIKSPDGFGTGTYEVLHPKGASIELTRSLFEGDVLQITSVRNTPDPALEKARGIRLYDGNKKLFDGYLRAPDYRRGSNKYRTLTTGVYDWRKELEAIYITESAGGTESYVDRTIDFILADLCRIANSAGVVKKQTYRYDPARLPYHPSFFETELISPTFTNTIWDAFTELTKQMDILEISRTGQWAIKIDSLQDDNYIYIIPQTVSIDTVAFGDFEVGAGFTDHFTHPYGLMLWAKTLEDITSSDLTLTITYTDQGGASPNTATITIPRDTPKGIYFPVPLEPGDRLVKDVTNITGSGGGTGNTVRVEGKGTRILHNWKLQPPKDIGKDYKKLLNHVIVKGQGTLKTQTLGEIPLLGTLQLTAFTGGSSTLINDIHAFFQTWGVKTGDRVKNVTKNQTCSVVSVISQMQLTTTPLTAASWDYDDTYEIDIGELVSSNDLYINTTEQPTKVNYLKITISNTTVSDRTGSVKLRGFSSPIDSPETLLEERFFLRVPAGKEISHVTDNRYYSLSMNISPNTGLNITGFWGCRIKVEEFMYGVAGRSINMFGLRADTILNMDFDTQLKCDSYAHELVESYHAPVVYISAVVKPQYIDTSDLVGRTVRLDDELTG